MKYRLAFLAAVLSLPTFTSCTCTPAVGEAVQGKIEGTVIKGVVSGGAVTAFAVNDSGRRTDVLASATTDDSGAFSMSIGGHSGSTLICATSGTYTEEATGGLVQLGAAELCALVDDHELGKTTSGVLVTPFTSFHATLSACFTEAGKEASLTAASQRGALRLNDFLSAGTSGFDFRATAPLDVTTGTAPGLTPEVWHGILLAGLSESARQISLASGLDPGVRVTAATLTTELLRDLDDAACVFDGQGPSGQLSQGNVALSANSLRGAPQGLAQSIERFLEGERNQSGVQPASVTDLTRALSTHASEIFGGDPGGDLDPPVVTIVEPAAGPVAGTPAIRVTATDVSAITEMVFTAPPELVGTGTFTCAEPTSCELEGVLNTALFPAGEVTITARATDQAGNSDDASVAVTINNSIPGIVVTSPSAGTLAGTVDIAATVSDPDGIATFAVLVPGATFQPICAPPTIVTNCDLELDPTLIHIPWDTTLMPEGPVTITFTATDTAGNPSFATVDAAIDNLAIGTISGTVDVGHPVVGSSVQVFELLDDGSEGVSLGTVLTNANGVFTVENPSSYAGPILARANGGSYVDPATGIGLTVNAGQTLTAALEATVAGGDTRLNLNPWTTLAADRAVLKRAESASLVSAINFSRGLFEKHFRRPGASLPILLTVSADLSDQTPDSESGDQTLLALASAGLSRIAAETCVTTGVALGSVTPLDVLTILRRDLDDGDVNLFDGRSVGVILDLDPGATVHADGYLLRRTLANAIFNYADNLALGATSVQENTSGVTGESLAQSGKVIDDVAQNGDANLFSSDEPPLPFDRQPPTIDFIFLDPHTGHIFGDTLSGTVTIKGTATDPANASTIARFVLLEPTDLVDLLGGSVPDLQVVIPEGLPNITAASAACGFVLGDPPLDIADPDAQVCVCAEAADSVDNVSHAVFCFARPAPAITLVRPSLSNPSDAFSACQAADCPAGVLPVPTDLAATVTGGFDLTECSFSVSKDTGESVLSGGGTIDENTCTISVPLIQDAPLVDGSYTFSVSATDLSGRTTTSSDSFVIDTRVGAVAISSPANNAHVSVLPAVLLVNGTASDTAGVAAVSVTFTGSNTATRTAGGTTSWTTTLSSPTAGTTDFTATAMDAFGNKATTPSRRVFLDGAPPTITEQPVGFREEPINVAITRTGTVAANTLTFIPNASVTTPTWLVSNTTTPPAGTPPTLRRWITRLDAISETPRIDFVVTDAAAGGTTDPALFTATYGIGTTCPTSAQATQVPTRSTNVFTANITDAATSVDLAAQTGAQTLCLAFFVKDEAQNTSAKYIFFRFQTVIPPLDVTFDGTLYSPTANSFDPDFLTQPNIDGWFELTNPTYNTPGYVADHAVIYNPHDRAIEANFSMSGTYSVRFLFGEQQDISNEELELFWSNTSDDLSNPLSGSSDSCTSNQSAGTSPLWVSNSFSTAVILDPPLSPVVGGCTSPPTGQAARAAPAKYRSTSTSDPRYPERTSADSANYGTVVDTRSSNTPSGFGSLTPTLNLFRLNNDGTLGSQVTITSGYASIPSRTRIVALFRVRHTAPSSAAYNMDCSATPSDFDAQCPLFSSTLTNLVLDGSPQSAAVPDFTDRCIMRTFESANGCATIFQSSDASDALSCRLSTSPHALCYLDKAFWYFQQAQLVTTTSNSLAQTYRVSTVSSTHTAISRSGTTRTIP
jgi:hypothetical protein